MSKKLLSGPYLLWMAAFTIIPLALIVYYGLMDKTGVLIMASVMAIVTVEHSKVPQLSLGLPLISTIICLLLAYSLAIILRDWGVGKGSLTVSIFILPTWINFLLHTLAWQTLLEKSGVINSILAALHLSSQPLIDTPGAIILDMVYNFLPFMVLPTYSMLYKIDDSAISVVHGLGANFMQTPVRTQIPLSLSGIISGITTVSVPALTTFVISNLLSGSKILLIENIIEQELIKGSNWHLDSGLLLVLTIFILISMVLIAKYDKQGEGTTF